MSTDAPGGTSQSGYRLDWMISVDDHILEPRVSGRTGAKAVGLSEAEIAAIKAGNCEALNESEVQLVGFVDSRLAGKDTSALRDALSTALGQPAVVQLAMLIGWSMIGNVHVALGVETDGN